jgi:hypothetical protein
LTSKIVVFTRLFAQNQNLMTFTKTGLIALIFGFTLICCLNLVTQRIVLIGIQSEGSEILVKRDESLNREIQQALNEDSSRPAKVKDTQPHDKSQVDTLNAGSELANEILRVFKNSPTRPEDPAVHSLLLSAKQAAERISESDSELLHEHNSERKRMLRISEFFAKRNKDTSDDSGEKTRKERVRVERRRYHHLMKEAEDDLSDGFPHQARRDLRRALARHEEEQRLKGFYGRSVYAKPKAFRLLEKTVADDVKDHLQAHKIEREMDRVIKVREDVESAKHRYEEEKKLVARAQKAGLHGMFRLSTREGGLKAEQSLTKRLDKSLSRQERAWLRAQALEAAKLRAAENAAPLAFTEHRHATSPTAASARAADSTGKLPVQALAAIPSSLASASPGAAADVAGPNADTVASRPDTVSMFSRTQPTNAAPKARGADAAPADLGKEHLPALSVGGADTASDIALYGHDVKLRHLEKEDEAGAAADGGGSTKTVHTQATDEILVRLLSLAHAGLLHPHMSLGLSHHPAHRHAAGDMHTAAIRDDVAAARPGGESEGSFASLIRGQLGGVLHGPRAAAAAARTLSSPAASAAPPTAAPSKVGAGGGEVMGGAARRRAGHAAGAVAYAARASAGPHGPATIWSALTSPLQFLFSDAKVAKVVVPT